MYLDWISMAKILGFKIQMIYIDNKKRIQYNWHMKTVKRKEIK